MKLTFGETLELYNSMLALKQLNLSADTVYAVAKNLLILKTEIESIESGLRSFNRAGVKLGTPEAAEIMSKASNYLKTETTEWEPKMIKFSDLAIEKGGNQLDGLTLSSLFPIIED